MLRPARLVIADLDAHGRSAVVADGPAPEVRESPAWPGAGVTLLWRSPAEAHHNADYSASESSLSPLPGGTTLMMWQLPPQAELNLLSSEERLRAQRPRMQISDRPPVAPSHPGMHATPTLDYVIVIRGEITLILEHGEVTLGPGDTVVDRGVRHAWENRGSEPSLCAIVNVDAPGWAAGRGGVRED